MIKLFWNTQNQHKSKTNKLENDKKNAVDLWWGLYHKKNSDEWIYNILKKIEYKIIESENEIEAGDILIVVDSSVEKKNDLYTKFKLICNKVFLIHLGDEVGSFDLSAVYSNFNFVWRTFCFNRYFNNNTIQCLPIGYKSGTYFKKNTDRKKYKWAFIGTPHKSSRQDLLYQFSNIEPHFRHKTEKFNERIIEVDQMSEVLSATTFLPCPNGFVHPETYRFYEALECQCIPIVENAYKYYDRLFPNNPFLKIDKWIDAKSLIKNWKDQEIIKKQKECQTWWGEYKNKLQISIKNKILL